MSIEELLLGVKTSVDALTAALKAHGGNAAVNTPAADNGTDKVTKVTYFNLVDKKQVVKVAAGGERPIGGLEVTAAEAKTLDAKYKADAAGNGQTSQTGATGAANAAASSTSTAAQSGSQSSGPSFKDVTEKITALSKKPEAEGGGRPAVLKLFQSWGVSKFPDAEGKKPNAELIADIEAVLNPQPEDGGLDDLGL